jgi:hypothetical protein
MRRVGARTVGQDESSVLLRQRGWRGEPPFLCGLLSGSTSDAPGVRSVIEDDNIAWPESWDKELFDVSHEAEPIDRTMLIRLGDILQLPLYYFKSGIITS